MEALQKLFFRHKSGTVIHERTIKGVLDRDYETMLRLELQRRSDFWYMQGTFEPKGRTPRRLREPNVEVV